MADDKGKKDPKDKKDEQKPSTVEKVSHAGETMVWWVEKLQNLGILGNTFLAILSIFGFRVGGKQGAAPAKGEGIPEDKSLTDMTPAGWTLKDEIEFGGVVSDHTDIRISDIEWAFRKRFREKFDEDHYRKIIIGFNRDYWNKMNNPPKKNEGPIKFKDTEVTNSARVFFDQLIAAVNEGGTADEIYKRQLERARGWGLMKEISTTSKATDHPFFTLTLLASAVMILIALFYLGILETITWILFG